MVSQLADASPGNIGGTCAPPLLHAPKRLLVPRNLPWPESYSIIWQIGIIHESGGWASQVYNAGLDLTTTASCMERSVRHCLHPGMDGPTNISQCPTRYVKKPQTARELGHRTIRPTWFEDDTSLHSQKSVPTQDAPQEMHGLKLMIREEIMLQDELPSFPALAHLAETCFLAPDAWNCRKLQVSLKVGIDVPMLGTIIETNGDNLEDSHMLIAWPLLIDGAVR